jgi:hypothetical protein
MATMAAISRNAFSGRLKNLSLFSFLNRLKLASGK